MKNIGEGVSARLVRYSGVRTFRLANVPTPLFRRRWRRALSRPSGVQTFRRATVLFRWSQREEILRAFYGVLQAAPMTNRVGKQASATVRGRYIGRWTLGVGFLREKQIPHTVRNGANGFGMTMREKSRSLTPVRKRRERVRDDKGEM